jgi:hypothetical protein
LRSWALVRLSSRVWLLLCGGLSGLGCIGGPISDWPRGGKSTNDSDHDDQAAEDDDDNSATDGDDDVDGDDGEPSKTPDVPPKDSPKRDAATGAGRLDAGRPSLDAGTTAPPSAGSDGDGGVPDAEIGAGGPQCTPSSDGRSAGACFGSYCRMTPDALVSGVEAEAACSGAEELSLACDGELSRVVAQCAQREALSIGMGRAIMSCARRASTLARAAEPCLDCYVDEIVCSIRSCLAACLDGSSLACAECRASKCGAAFVACSGLPAPEGETPQPMGGVDGGLSRRW